MIIAVDFDNTIAGTTFPEIHGEIAGAIDALKRFQQAGHTIILWTCREGKVLNDALFWLADHGFSPDCVNCHSEKQIAEWGTDPRKIGADVYIDDRNALCEIDWKRIEDFINGKTPNVVFDEKSQIRELLDENRLLIEVLRERCELCGDRSACPNCRIDYVLKQIKHRRKNLPCPQEH